MRGLVLLFLIACGGEGTQIPRAQATTPGELLFNGYTKPAVKCFSCHDGTGAGTNYGPALSARVPTLDDAQLRAVILDGKGKMPPFRTKLTDAEADAIITWLQQRFGDAR